MVCMCLRASFQNEFDKDSVPLAQGKVKPRALTFPQGAI
jgi:hypothetical protein